MAIRLPKRIVRYPDPVLRRKCEAITHFDGELAALIKQMFTLMQDGNGVGLAAPQVGLAMQLFVCNPTGEPADNRAYINPVLSDLAGNVEAEEGCLSLPDIHVMIYRARKCRIQAVDAKGQPFEESAEDLLARIWQHETDHLHGQLIADRMSRTDQIANKRKLAELEKEYRQRIPASAARRR